MTDKDRDNPWQRGLNAACKVALRRIGTRRSQTMTEAIEAFLAEQTTYGLCRGHFCVTAQGMMECPFTGQDDEPCNVVPVYVVARPRSTDD